MKVISIPMHSPACWNAHGIVTTPTPAIAFHELAITVIDAIQPGFSASLLIVDIASGLSDLVGRIFLSVSLPPA